MKRFLRVAIPVSLLAGAPAWADEPSVEAQAALADIRATFGFVPGFMAAFPDEGLPGAWAEFKGVQLNPASAIPGKYKELIGLGVASQIPCEYCVYFHTKAAKANGASDREIKEAVAMSAIVRHWSTYLNGAQIDEAAFRGDLAQAVQNAKAGAKPTEPIAVTDAQTARADIRQTFGLVPGFFNSFPDEGLAGAWREMKGLQLNPSTSIPNKYKELIGLAVASQIPCRYCIAFHTKVASELDGASAAEVQETIVMASIVRHWSTFLNGMQIDKNAFRAEVNRALAPKRSAGIKTARRN
jgi:AhpD family alkylhydroperoxidase